MHEGMIVCPLFQKNVEKIFIQIFRQKYDNPPVDVYNFKVLLKAIWIEQTKTRL